MKDPSPAPAGNFDEPIASRVPSHFHVTDQPDTFALWLFGPFIPSRMSADGHFASRLCSNRQQQC